MPNAKEWASENLLTKAVKRITQMLHYVREKNTEPDTA